MVPVLGFLSCGAWSPLHASVLFLLGLLFHISGCTLNDLSDREVDSLSPELEQKPLLRGTVTERGALVQAFAAVGILEAVALLYFQDAATMLFLALLILIGGLYNLLGKRAPFADITFPIWVALLCLFGAWSSGRPLGWSQILLALLLFCYYLVVNNIIGGLKDIAHDHLRYRQTTLHRLGAGVVRGRVRTGLAVRAYAFGVQAVFFVLLLLAWLVVAVPGLEWSFGTLPGESSFPWLLTSLPIGFGLLQFWSLNSMLRETEYISKASYRKRLFRTMVGHIVPGHLAVVSLSALTVRLPPPGLFSLLAFLALFPFAWFFAVNRALYGGPWQPS